VKIPALNQLDTGDPDLVTKDGIGLDEISTARVSGWIKADWTDDLDPSAHADGTDR
jgi:hypothetical protein